MITATVLVSSLYVDNSVTVIASSHLDIHEACTLISSNISINNFITSQDGERTLVLLIETVRHEKRGGRLL